MSIQVFYRGVINRVSASVITYRRNKLGVAIEVSRWNVSGTTINNNIDELADNLRLHAIYKHRNKYPPRKSPDNIEVYIEEIFGKDEVVPRTDFVEKVTFQEIKIKGSRRIVFRDSKGRFTKKPKNAELIDTGLIELSSDENPYRY